MKTSFVAESFGEELRMDAEGTVSELRLLTQHDFWTQFVPGVELLPGKSDQEPDLQINIETGASWLFDADDGSLVLSPQDITHAICTAGYMLEAKRQAQGLYTVHGNVISHADATVALIGPISGIGKTGLSSHAAGRGWQWVSDEKFVMNGLGDYVGSVRGILQDEKSRRSAGEHVPGANGSFDRRIRAFVIPLVVDADAFVDHRYNQGKAFWHLYEELTHDVRMTPMILGGPEVPLPSFDTAEIALRRRAVAAALSETVPVIATAGNADAILDYLTETIR